MKIYLGSDHAGFDLKPSIKVFLADWGHEVVDLGPKELNTEDDYPDYVLPVAKRVASEPDARGIVIGGSGQGEAMAANRVRGIRAAVFYGGSEDVVRLSREHNNANVLSLGARFVSNDEAKSAVKLWLETPFSGEERHVRRLAKLDGNEI